MSMGTHVCLDCLMYTLVVIDNHFTAYQKHGKRVALMTLIQMRVPPKSQPSQPFSAIAAIHAITTLTANRKLSGEIHAFPLSCYVPKRRTGRQSRRAWSP